MHLNMPDAMRGSISNFLFLFMQETNIQDKCQKQLTILKVHKIYQSSVYSFLLRFRGINNLLPSSVLALKMFRAIATCGFQVAPESARGDTAQFLSSTVTNRTYTWRIHLQQLNSQKRCFPGSARFLIYYTTSKCQTCIEPDTVVSRHFLSSEQQA